MSHDIPVWAKERISPEHSDFFAVRRAYHQGRTQLQWPDQKALRAWAKAHGWPTPRFAFKDAFIAKMFESNATFTLALSESGVELYMPIKEHTITPEALEELDRLYEERSSSGRPTGWGALVRELRAIRRLVEAGVTVNVAGTPTVLNTWQHFYAWAHGRYHMLEDGYDSWIGDDA